MKNIKGELQDFYYASKEQIVSGTIKKFENLTDDECALECQKSPLININTSAIFSFRGTKNTFLEHEYTISIWSSELKLINQVMDQLIKKASKWHWGNAKIRLKKVLTTNEILDNLYKKEIIIALR